MRILAIETSAKVASVAILEDEKLLFETVLNHRYTHSKMLLPAVEQALESTELIMQDITAVGVSVGPGSFTGLRIGVATAKSLAHAAQCPIVGISTLDALAMNIPYFYGLCVPIMDARCNQVYTATYTWEQGELCKELQDTAKILDELILVLQKQKREVLFIGDGVPVYQEQLSKAMGNQAVFAPPSHCLQRASSVALLAKKALERGLPGTYADVLPNYIRLPQAERELLKKG